MSILLLDFEATGVDAKTVRPLEIGAMLVDHNWQPLGYNLSTLVYDKAYPPISPEVKAVTGISEEMLVDAASPRDAMVELSKLAMVGQQPLDYVVAYNRSYDEVLFKEEAKRLDITMLPGINWIMSTPWLCAMVDVHGNYKFKSWKMMHVALEYGVTVNPKELHRAINDVELMRKLLEASGTTPSDMYKFQSEPWIYLRALCAKPWEDNGLSTGEAKINGFGWEGCKGDETSRRFEKAWVKRVKRRDVEEQLKAPLHYKVVEIGE